jgi:hypothetical protein
MRSSKIGLIKVGDGGTAEQKSGSYNGVKRSVDQAEDLHHRHRDGSNGDAQLFNALKIDQSTLERWFDEVEDLDDNEKAALFFLVDNNGMDDAMDNRDEVMLRDGTLKEVGEEIFDETYPVLDRSIWMSIDIDSCARDLRLAVETINFSYDRTRHECINASGL